MNKVCHLTSVHHRYDTRILYKECISLSRAGWEVHLIVADDLSDEKLEGVFIHSVGQKKGKIKRMIKSSKRVYLKGVELDADIYHIHDPELIPYATKLKRIGKKVIYDAHEDLPQQLKSKDYIPGLVKTPLAWTLENYENYVTKKLDLIITATPHIRKRFEEVNEKVVDINNYPLLDDLDLTIQSWESKKNEICYVGSITKIRGLSQVIDAMEFLNGISLNFAGNYSPESYIDELKQKKGWKSVNFLGRISRSEAKQVIAASKVGIVTFLPYGNHIHSQPNKLFEYMAQGIPIVASDFQLWKDIVEDYNCGICIDPANPREIANAVLSLLEDEKKAELMGQNGRNVILEKFNWESEQKKLLENYQRL